MTTHRIAIEKLICVPKSDDYDFAFLDLLQDIEKPEMKKFTVSEKF